MQRTPAMLWNTSKIKQCEDETGQALLRDEQTLVSFSQDFGKLIQSPPSAVCKPTDTKALQSLILFAAQYKLPITIRGNGLSQCGQSLAIPGGLTVSMQNFSKPLNVDGETIWVEANSSWASLLEVSLKEGKAPYILPYNCNLSIGGVLSAGGVGASSFKYGSINAHVQALEVIDGMGEVQVVDKQSPLFRACLSGQGRFAVITKAQIQLKQVKSHVKTFCLVYGDEEQWFEDINLLKDKADYLELFCSPSIQGAKLQGEKRIAMAQWLYGLHFSVEYEEIPPDFRDIGSNLKPWQVIHAQEETISSYLLRHNSRFDVMKMLGQWDLLHPWYECFVPTEVLKKNLHQILKDLPIYYANLVHIAPIANQKVDFLMFPKNDSVCSFMILNPGVPNSLKDGCLQAIQDLDKCLLEHGGKRYLSGFIGTDLSKNYWSDHFGDKYSSWVDLKKEYDPNDIFTSMLYQNNTSS